MACIMELASPLAMPTTQLKRETANQGFAPVHFESNGERQSLCMNWVVVTGQNGSRLSMRWTAEESRRNL
jgi:hypothetical protein